MVIFRPILVTLLLLISNLLFAKLNEKELSQYSFEALTSEDGLPTNGVLHLYQTTDKYLWLSTYNGLVRYNGVSMHVLNQGNTDGLTTHSFTYMLETKNARWFGSQAGLIKYSNHQWEVFTEKEGLIHNEIHEIVEDQKGNLWIGTPAGLCYFDIEKNKIISSGIPSVLKKASISDLKIDQSGKLWIGTKKSGLFRYNIDTKKFDYNNKKIKNIKALVLDQNESLWIGGSGYLKKLNKELKVSSFDQIDQLPSKNITALFEDSKGALWIGTDHGIARYFNQFISSFSKNKEIGKHIVCSILEDHEGNYWVGTYQHGAYRLNLGQFTSYGVEQGLTGNFVYSISEGISNDEILLATNGGITVYQNNAFTPHWFNSQLKTKSVKDVFVDSKENTWIASKRGLTKIDRYQKVTHYTKKDGLSNNYARFTFEDAYGNIWVGTIDGLNILQKDGRFKTFTTQDGLTNNFILSIFEDNQKKLWICTKGGVTTYKNGKFYNFTKLHQLNSEPVFKVIQDHRGVIWYGTNNGIFRVEGDKVFSYHRKIEGEITSVFNIIEDRKNNLFWISCNVGVYTLKIDELNQVYRGNLDKVKLKLYSTKDGMKSKSVMANGRSLVRKNGEIWFHTYDGVSIVNCNDIIVEKTPPTVIINKVMVNGETVSHTADQFEIPEGNTRLEIAYEGISLLHPEGITYKYKLEGFDEDWIYAEENQNAIYTNLPPEDYTFVISAGNQDNVWLKKPVRLEFKKLASFYERLEIQLLFAVLFFVALFFTYRWRVRRFKLREMVLERRVTERTKEIYEKSEELLQQSEELQQQAEELQQQRDYLSETNDLISERNDELNTKNEEVSDLIKQVKSINSDMKIKNKRMTDSIRYAKTMQFALLPSAKKLQRAFADHFIIFKPKDIVSGDFYWMTIPEDNTTFVASVDCTGHGVPGGFMSMLGISILNKIIKEHKEYDTVEILTKLNASIIDYLQQENSDIDDGMDLALLKVVSDAEGATEVTFTGAKSTVYFYKTKENQLISLKGDNISIGGRSKKKKEKKFTSHSIQLQKGDKIYLSTDGYIDQNNHLRKKIGKKLFEGILQGTSKLEMSKQKEQLEHLLQRHQGDEDQRDDITVIGLKL
ncbi:two-component regulator propeller domain-containing protein [Flammeovirga sp. EKP202]|uniref:two-component regulator propeller domain-containing protein n=1 Tax=Flammeovirga sp. EKP202 TaxID=2770592 RepID=UPI00165EFCAA|nr:two-component regulator propeller domain-containing protein [Flammeovirga sp. EKP202]MBD0400023.1 SpoIIE family protein phosphatase [Flammeovirga sp. EKP202]